MIRGPIALATCRQAFGLDTDMAFLIEALNRAEITADVVPWDDDADWSKYSLVVIRSTWDYHRRYSKFMDWVRRVASQTKIANTSDVVTWNSDKRYLNDLASVGLPIVPTTFVAPGDPVDQAALRTLLATGDVVVKPTISAGSNDTERHLAFDDITAHVQSLQASGRTAMVQPYMRDIEATSETGLVYIDGEFSHAFAKGTMLRDPKTMTEGLYAEERIEARSPSSAERAIGDRVIGEVTTRFGGPLYTRVDLVPTSDGPVIMEVEMIEPSLYVHLATDAADRLADAIKRRIA